MSKKLLIISLFAFISYTSWSQEIWDSLKLPANLITEISSYTSSGMNHFLGTNGQGVFSSNDSGKTWTNNSIPKEMTDDSIQIINISSTGYVFAYGRAKVFRTGDLGTTWEKCKNFNPSGSVIQCAAISPVGWNAVGTSSGIYLSSFGTNGLEWQKITNNKIISDFDTRTMLFNQNEQLFVSGFHLQEPTIYTIDLNSGSIDERTTGITEKPLVNDFTLDTKGIMHAAVGLTIYNFDDHDLTWTVLAVSGQTRIKTIRFDRKGNLFSFDSNSLLVFGSITTKWLPDDPILKFDKNIVHTVIGNDGNIVVVLPDAIKKTLKPSDEIITYLDFGTKVFLVSNPKTGAMKNTSFDLFKATCDNNQVFIKKITTDSRGKFFIKLDDYGILITDQLKLEKKISFKYSIKTEHTDFGNRLYDIFLNNMKFDGIGSPSYYSMTDVRDQTLLMDHTMIPRFLVVSVEWDAKREYLDSLASWCKLMSEFLYDVTDGQLFVEGISIYDCKQKWDQADIRIFASNMVWPNAAINGIYKPDADQAQIRMPRRWWGNSVDTRNFNAKSDWFTLNENAYSIFMSSTIAHELGHYMFGFYDEYLWTNEEKQKLVTKGFNFGFMNFQYQTAPDWSSEMSTQERYTDTNYRYTFQWKKNGSDCWTQFKNKYEDNYNLYEEGYIWCPIKTPAERTLSKGYNFMVGPMDFQWNQRDCSVKNLMNVIIHDQGFGTGDYIFTVQDEYSNPSPNAEVYLMTSNPIYQGQSADNGKMIVLGAKVNDKITVTQKREIYFPFIGPKYYYYCFTTVVDAVTKVKDGHDSQLDGEPTFQLIPVKGENRLINTMRYDESGNINFQIFTEKNFNKSPTVDIPIDDGHSTLTNFGLSYNNKNSIYNLIMNQAVTNQGTIFFNTVDSLSNPFSILFQYNISNFGENISAPDGSAELILDSNNKSINYVSALSSNFAPLRNGIPKEARQAGQVVSFSTTPSKIDKSTLNILTIRYSKSNLSTQEEQSLNIFRWDEDSLKWKILGGIVDSTRQEVHTTVNSDGTFAAFSTYSSTGVQEENMNYYRLDTYPNPFTSNSTIEFYLPYSANTSLSLHNTLGQELMTFANSYLNYGKQTFNLNGILLESGVYYLKLNVDGMITTKKVVILK